jgi:hypothetical protein
MSAPQSQTTPGSPPPPHANRRPEIFVQLDKFWLRVTEGLEVGQLWKQFSKDARTSYRLYQKDFDRRAPGESWRKNFFHTLQDLTRGGHRFHERLETLILAEYRAYVAESNPASRAKQDAAGVLHQSAVWHLAVRTTHPATEAVERRHRAPRGNLENVALAVGPAGGGRAVEVSVARLDHILPLCDTVKRFSSASPPQESALLRMTMEVLR